MTSSATTGQAVFLRYDRTLGVAAMESRGFYYPVDLAIGDDGRMYGLSRSHEGDPRGVRVCILDYDGGFHGVFGSIGDADGQFTFATGIALDSRDRVYVSDEHTQRISVFDKAGAFLSKWGTPGSGPGEIDGPCGLAFGPDDVLYVTDHLNHRIQTFTADGAHLSCFGEHGSGDGQFDLPWGITVLPDGQVYVADWGNDRVQRFSASGEFIAAYGESGEGDGQFHRPSGVAVDSDGYIYVADWGNDRVQVLEPDGGFVQKLMGEATLSTWGAEFLAANVDEAGARARSDLEPDPTAKGWTPDQAPRYVEKLFWAPTAVKLDAEGRLYVVDRNRHRIQVYQKDGKVRPDAPLLQLATDRLSDT